MTPQELQDKLETAEMLFRETYIRAYLAEWWQEVVEKRELITPSDWINVSLIQLEMLFDAQGLSPEIGRAHV